MLNSGRPAELIVIAVIVIVVLGLLGLGILKLLRSQRTSQGVPQPGWRSERHWTVPPAGVTM